MIVQFFDRQDTANPMDGMLIRNSVELRQLLDRLRDRQPFFAELISNSHKLLLGIGASNACVQYSATDGSAPYLMAVAKDAPDVQGEAEFLIGDTTTPVPMQYCLPYDTMVEVAAWFADSGKRYPGVTWEWV